MKLQTFINLIKGQINKGIYVWGGQGELLSSISPEWIKKKENSTANYEKALKMYEIRKKYADARAFDCSGLVCWALVECGAEKKGFDKTANGLMTSMCDSVSKSQLRDGDLCFKVSDGKAHHVGVYVGGKIIEAKGRAYGVVSSSVTSSWDKFGRLKVFKDEVPEQKFVLTRLLKKGMKGDDVKAVQNLLIKKGYALPKYGADGSFGTETDRAVRRFQIDKNLKCDGIVGKDTIKALGGEWK